MSRLKNKYETEVLPKMKEEFNLRNSLSVPKLKKIVVSIGVGEAKDDKSILTGIVSNLAALSGQQPVVTLAKKSIATFKLSAGAPVGVMVTLRGDRMYVFLDKLFNAVLPKVRDFRGIDERSFDKQGNFNLGLREQLIFPEVDYKTVDKGRGLAITIVTTAKEKTKGKRLLELLGMPFKKG